MILIKMRVNELFFFFPFNWLQGKLVIKTIFHPISNYCLLVVFLLHLKHLGVCIQIWNFGCKYPNVENLHDIYLKNPFWFCVYHYLFMEPCTILTHMSCTSVVIYQLIQAVVTSCTFGTCVRDLNWNPVVLMIFYCMIWLMRIACNIECWRDLIIYWILNEKDDLIISQFIKVFS